MSVILKCENLTKKYGNKTALKDINLNIESGKLVGLLGPNGSGKTTFIKMAERLVCPTSGSIEIEGMIPGKETKKIISYLPDKFIFDERIKVKEAIDLYKSFFDDFDENMAKELLADLKIDDNDRFRALSKGTKDKVQLILTMSRKAKLYLLDEPIGGVDPAGIDYIIKTIIANYNEEATVIIATHLISDVENILDDVIFIKEGEIVLHKSVDAIREEEGKSVDSLFREMFKYTL
ncbi:MAG: ABC transporter ATP-binding protein [Lachnospiraceae bacterium]|nr:ABC transporter ATP-binding protein [Lachnospiraceae bacterium]